jgi:hypothetical protein
MKKIIKILLQLTLVIFFSTSLFFQFIFERYIDNKREKCCFLNKERVSYKPAIVYYLQYYFNEEIRELDEVSGRAIYYKSACKEQCKIHHLNWDIYMISSFLTKKEKLELISSVFPESPIPTKFPITEP